MVNLFPYDTYMKLIELEIKTSKFNILNVKENEFDITTAHNYDADYLPIDGGINVNPKFEIESNLNGRLLIRQVCLSHEFNVCTLNEKIPFQLTTTTKDTISPSGLNYKTYTIKEGNVYDELGSIKCAPIFFDSLQQELFSHWIDLDYKIEFQTFYILEQDGEQFPIFTFYWSAEASCEKKEGNWNITLNRISSEQEVKESIQESNIEIPEFEQLSQLKSEVANHFIAKKELQKK